MKIVQIRTGVWLGLIVVVASLLLAVSYAPVTHAATANTLKVSPVRTDIETKPGASKIVQTTVTNLTDTPITVRPTVNDFVAGDERGSPALILDEGKFAPSHSLKRFMAPLADITIPARQAKTINVVITVPVDAPAGGYFGAVRFTPSAGDTGGQVNLSPSVASLVLLTVPGETVEKVELTRFDIQQGGSTGSYFFSSEDLHATVRFKNDGSVQIGPFGKVSVQKGDKVIYETDFNNKDQRDMILPDSARIWDIPLDNIDSFGEYTVTATFTYGLKNQTIEVVKSFWVIPPILIIIASVALLIIAGVIVSAVLLRRRSRHRRRMMRNHQYHRR